MSLVLKGAGFAVFLALVGSCSSFSPSEESIARELGKDDVSPEFGFLETGERTLRFMMVGSDDLPRVLFIHGAPGSLDNYNRYLALPELRDAAQLVSVDRPGYGASGYGQAEPNLARQSAMISRLLVPGTIVVGHSFGGTVAMRVAMDNPDMVGGIVLIAPSLSPEVEKTFFFNRPMERKALNWLMPRAWKVSNTEKLAQKANLEAMLPLWERVRVPVFIAHGTRDGLVPVEHSLVAATRLPANSTTVEILEGEGHMILWSESEMITQAILSFLPGQLAQSGE